MLGFEPHSLDLGPKGDKALRMELGGGWTDVQTDVHTDGQIPPVFYRTLFPSGPLPKNHNSLEYVKKSKTDFDFFPDKKTGRPMDKED